MLSRKRATPGCLDDDLPHPRRFCFRRHLQDDIEAHFRHMIAEHLSTRSQSQSSTTLTQPGLKVVFGRVVGEAGSSRQDVILPFASETILQGHGHLFEPHIAVQLADACRLALAQKIEASHQEKRWADTTMEEHEVQGNSNCSFAAVVTVFCPGSRFHYQLRLDAGNSVESASGATIVRKETRFVFFKVKSSEDPAWRVSIVTETYSGGKRCWIELGLNEDFLFNHFQRMKASRPHCFSRICRDFRRNAKVLAGLMNSLAVFTGQEQSCFYPGTFCAAASVQEFYSSRALQGSQVPASQRTEQIRRLNNLVKTMLLERFLDDLPGEVRILDIGCGRGQDVNKYSRENRRAAISVYVGIDFAAEAVQEARTRYSSLVERSRKRGTVEYAATFYAGDCRTNNTFAMLRSEGHTQFDALVCQFALQYLLESENAARFFLRQIRELLRPGGRFIATAPSCEVLADFFESAQPLKDSAHEKLFRRSFFSLRYAGQPWTTLLRTSSESELDMDTIFLRTWGMPYSFTLDGSVDGLEYILPWEAFEDMATEEGFRVVMDAPFPDLFREFQKDSRFYNNVFNKDSNNRELDEEEQMVFKMYSGFVLERT